MEAGIRRKSEMMNVQFDGEDSDLHRYLDGTGREGKRDTDTCDLSPIRPEDPCTWHEKIEYFVRSTVLGGQVVSDVDNTGKKTRTYVHAAGEVIAWQNLYGTTESVLFRQSDASGMSIKSTGTNGVASGGNGYEGAPAELDPLGGNVGTESPYINPSGEPCLGCDILLPYEPSNIDPNEPNYQIDGFDVSRAVAMSYISVLTGWNAQSILAQYSLRWQFASLTHVYETSSGETRWEDLSTNASQTSLDNRLSEGGYLIAIYEFSWSLNLTSIQGKRQNQKFPPFKKSDLKVVTDALKLAKELAKEKKCDEALKDYGIPSIAKLLDGLSVDGTTQNTFDGRESSLTFQDNNGKQKTIAEYFKENKASVGAAVFPNSVTGRGPVTFVGDYFFNPASIDWVAQQRAIILIHEAVHAIGAKGDGVFGSSRDLSEKIIEKCYPVLKGKLGGVG
ncbi:MAG: hypothetical protein ACRD6X_17645 [Pyrinomonadaceae bacterium]